MDVAEIVELLKLKDWSHEQLAEKLDVGRSTVTCWVTGARKPHRFFVRAIRAMLDEARRSTSAEPAAK